MSRTCQITGKKPSTGNNRPFSLKATRRTFRPNLFVKKIWNPLTNKVERIRVSAKGLKTIKKWMSERGMLTEEAKQAKLVSENAKHTTNELKGRVHKTKLTPKQKKELEAQKTIEKVEEAKPEIVKEMESAKKEMKAEKKSVSKKGEKKAK
ncbi:50S ribosomal protein L28 [Candidatus Gracilibacteria bacterium]|nr:50S ribosomal protein L28 [Candidatus Gracilibacteria bacterium]